jgi:hypothetical protein
MAPNAYEHGGFDRLTVWDCLGRAVCKYKRLRL